MGDEKNMVEICEKIFLSVDVAIYIDFEIPEC